MQIPRSLTTTVTAQKLDYNVNKLLNAAPMVKSSCRNPVQRSTAGGLGLTGAATAAVQLLSASAADSRLSWGHWFGCWKLCTNAGAAAFATPPNTMMRPVLFQLTESSFFRMNNFRLARIPHLVASSHGTYCSFFMQGCTRSELRPFIHSLFKRLCQ
jgi:hypothetical protein